MADVQLSLTADERKYLVELLGKVLKDAQVEEHRTRTPSYREFVMRDEKLIASVLNKLGQPPA